ncbi:unnamed protein product [Symbiodinium natans]|uniref:Uncharacterized protein n=1 Tax=Symbiodinium natans TaxID=878477 RepID=A0A812RRX0_9DINO|nr:unnamed protein product [Symbiodinium natans]
MLAPWIACGCCEAPADLTHEVLQIAASLDFVDEKKHDTEVAEVDDIETGSTQSDLVMSVDLDQPVVLFTFTRRNGESEELKVTSKPLCFRIGHTHPYTVTDIAAGSNSVVQEGWVLTHVNGEMLPLQWKQAASVLRKATQRLPQTRRSSLKEPAPGQVSRKSVQSEPGQGIRKSLQLSPEAKARSDLAATFKTWVPAGSVEHSIMQYQSSLVQTMRAAR